jgi:hypothetical protein
MENNVEFKRMVASIKELEQQLLQIDDKQLELQGIKIEYMFGIYSACLLLCGAFKKYKFIYLEQQRC